MARSLAVVAGLPPEIEVPFRKEFVSKLVQHESVELTLLSTRSGSRPYTREYAKNVYDELACELRERGGATRESLLAGTRLLVLFLRRTDESHEVLYEKLGVEAFVTPLTQPEMFEMPLTTRSQRNRVVNDLIRETRRAIRHARSMLSAIYEEVNNRENKTCLLLPPKTFGSEFHKVQRRVWDAAAKREETTSFVRSLKALRLARSGKHYRGHGNLVFTAPSKAGPRHGLPPIWTDGHEPSCVIRGRLRFGAPFDPRFHYDCPLHPASNRTFPGCHESESLPSDRNHANCAPNDRIR